MIDPRIRVRGEACMTVAEALDHQPGTAARRRGSPGSSAGCAATRSRSLSFVVLADRDRSSRCSRPGSRRTRRTQTDFANTFAPPGTAGPPARHRRPRPRRALPDHARAAGVAAGRRCSRSPRRCVIGVPLGLTAGYFRAADAVISRFTDLRAGVPVPDPGGRAGGDPRREPRQRRDRDRHRADPRRDPGRPLGHAAAEVARLRRRRGRRRRRRPVGAGPARPARTPPR